MEKNEQLQRIPNLPGVYFFKDASGTVIYIGKAKALRKRVNSYFRNKAHDWKIEALMQEYATIDFIITTTEIEALLLEAQLVGQHKPKYNVLLKDGQPFLYIMLTKDELPKLELVRNKKKAGNYVGPFLQKTPTRAAYNFLMRTFQLSLCNKTIKNGCLQYHIGRCAGSCMEQFDKQDYLVRLNLAFHVLKNDRSGFVKLIQARIAHYNTYFEFEKSRNLHNYLQDLDIIFATLQAKFTEKKFNDQVFASTTPLPTTSSDKKGAAEELQQLIGASTPVQIIDCFDISHNQSSYLVGACVRFVNGVPDKNKFRRFKIKTLTQQNDYAALQEIVARRYRDRADLPDLILIDGGKGQLSAAKALLPDAPIISLAKREETIFGPHFMHGIKLDIHTPLGKTLIALRDYTHHFAISYHRLRRSKNK